MGGRTNEGVPRGPRGPKKHQMTNENHRHFLSLHFCQSYTCIYLCAQVWQACFQSCSIRSRGERVCFVLMVNLILREGIPTNVYVYFSSVVPNIPGYIGSRLLPVHWQAKIPSQRVKQIKRLVLQIKARFPSHTDRAPNSQTCLSLRKILSSG